MNENDILKKYRSICREHGVRPYPKDEDGTIRGRIGMHIGELQDVARLLEKALKDNTQ